MIPDDLARELERVKQVIQADPETRERLRQHVAAKADEAAKRVNATRRLKRDGLTGGKAVPA